MLRHGKNTTCQAAPRRFLAAAIAAAAIGVFVLSPPATAQSLTVKVGTSPPEQHPLNQVLMRWAAAVDERSGGDIKIELFPSGQLGGQKEMFEGLKLGSLQAAEVTVSVTSSLVPQIGVFDLPFLYRSTDHMFDVYSGAVGDWLADQYVDQGYRVLGFVLGGVRHPFGKHGLESPENVKGAKIRVIQSPLHIEIWQLAGANPTPIPDPEIYSSLQTGVVDFADNTKSNYYGRKWYEVAPVITTLGHIYAINALTVSEDWWQGLTPEQQIILYDTFQELVPVQHEMIVAGDATALEQAEAAGATIVEVPDLQPWKTVMQPIWEKWAAEVPGGQTLIDAVEATP